VSQSCQKISSEDPLRKENRSSNHVNNFSEKFSAFLEMLDNKTAIRYNRLTQEAMEDKNVKIKGRFRKNTRQDQADARGK
jgi:hypothetical protein